MKGTIARDAALVALVMTLSSAATTHAQFKDTRLPYAVLGGLAGVAAGSVIGISLIVAESRYGRYVHDADDVTGWRSLPVTIGIATGTLLGIYSPHRLETSFYYGVAGMTVGAAAGLGLGSLIWEPPEGRWAGAAIGAGVGLTIGGVAGMLFPLGGEDGLGTGGAGQGAGGVPVVVRVRF